MKIHMKNMIKASANLPLQNCQEIVEDGTKEVFKLSEKVEQLGEAEQKLCVFEFKSGSFNLR